ncbi:MAG: YeeE/YedE family protein, partial [Candidatus Puniceispirillaceae bacterium]
MTQTAEHHYQISQKTGFGLLGLAAITVLCLILLDSGIAGAGLFIVGGALGAMFFGVSFGFAS